LLRWGRGGSFWTHPWGGGPEKDLCSMDGSGGMEGRGGEGVGLGEA